MGPPAAAVWAASSTMTFVRGIVGIVQAAGWTAIVGGSTALLAPRMLCQQNPKPPTFYISKGACPFECCRYGKWIARRPVGAAE